jgi:hypothetical protein
MKSYAASSFRKYGICQQVIHIDEHSSHHNEPGLLPVVSEKNPGNEPGCNKMKSVVNKQLKHNRGGKMFNSFSKGAFIPSPIRIFVSNMSQIGKKILVPSYQL